MSSRVAHNWLILFLSGSILVGGAAFSYLAANAAPSIVAIALGGSTFSAGIGSTNFNELFVEQPKAKNKQEIVDLLKELECALVDLLKTIEQI